MNKKLTVGILTVLLVVAASAAITFGTISRVTVSANVPVQLTTNSTAVLGVTFVGAKAPRTNNTGIVYVQVANTTNAAAYPIAPGQTLTLTSSGRFLPINLTNFWVESLNDGDGVQVIYTQ
jgi:hypothetical protein